MDGCHAMLLLSGDEESLVLLVTFISAGSLSAMFAIVCACVCAIYVLTVFNMAIFQAQHRLYAGLTCKRTHTQTHSTKTRMPICALLSTLVIGELRICSLRFV